MTDTELQAIRYAITLLCSLIGAPQEGAPAPQHGPIRHFAEKYLTSDPDADLSCAEAWQFYQEIAQAGDLPPMRKTAFLRQLPVVMETVFNVRKCHHIERGDCCQRGFRGINLRLDAGSPSAL